jgi:trehalose 6-phosphate synthase
MSRLIVVSNRVSPPVARRRLKPRRPRHGDLRGAARIFRHVVRLERPIDAAYTGQLSMQTVNGVTVATIDLEEQDIDEYYNGYANRTLWPLFHYRIDLTQYERSYGEGYERVNARFADALRR